mmetsp:Transcript_9686/g.18714  ORF Transcript_9686/g.18714 Transcript_9686/m.18714 type:complete len:505 (-) Transcript_9686:120-1634(-)
MTSSRPRPLSFLHFCGGVFLYLVAPPRTSNALKHSFDARHDPRQLIGPVGMPFGFLAGGEFSLTVENFSLVSKIDQTKNLVEAGFWLQRFPNEASFQHFMNEIQEKENGCVFEYFRDDDPNDEIFDQVGKIEAAQPEGLFLSMKDKTKWGKSTLQYTFKPGEEGLYFLVYQVCHSSDNSIRAMSTFHLDFHFVNFDSSGQESYLTAGEIHLPLLYTLSATSFTICAILWQWNLQRIRKGLPAIIRTKEEQAFESAGRPTIYAIHPIMGLLLWVKSLTVWAEAFRFHTIKITGHAEAWSILYYTLYFFRGTFLFTVILLIGTGWSFVKGVLQKRDKQFIFLVLFLQMLNQLALIVLSHETEGERRFGNWNAVLHLVDIICCCSVLLPIVWQVNAMEASLQLQDDEDDQLSAENRASILEKLKLFRLFYLLVIAYIYATRILIYLFATALDYQHLWLRYAVVEMVTLVFYVTVGLLFRPRVELEYVTAPARQEEEGVALIDQSSSV